LTILDRNTGNSKIVWAISNSKVLCFYLAETLNSIAKLYRNSNLQLKDINGSSCFIASTLKEKPEDGALICAVSSQEKEVWISSIRSYLPTSN
jgi:hypothetical protein